MFEKEYPERDENFAAYLDEVYVDELASDPFYGAESQDCGCAHREDAGDLYSFPEAFKQVSGEEESMLDSLFEDLSMEEKISLKKAFKSGKKLLQKKVLPNAGRIVGSIYGGQAGAKLGKQVDHLLQGPKKSRQDLNTGTRKPEVARGLVRANNRPMGTQDGSLAAAQLLILLQDPNMLKGIMTLALGRFGKSRIQLEMSGKSIPVLDIARLINQLAQQVLIDARKTDTKRRRARYIKTRREEDAFREELPTYEYQTNVGGIYEAFVHEAKLREEYIPEDYIYD